MGCRSAPAEPHQLSWVSLSAVAGTLHRRSVVPGFLVLAALLEELLVGHGVLGLELGVTLLGVAPDAVLLLGFFLELLVALAAALFEGLR